MKAIRIHEFGGPEVLKEEDVPAPEAGAGQALIRVYATSLNPIELKKASGKMQAIFPLQFPWIPGADVSGVIERVGENVTQFKTGDEVYGVSPDGGAYAEFVAVETRRIALKPRLLSHAEAASMAVVGQTAWQALDQGKLEKGQTILVHGAAGGVGSVAVQLAHHLGARVIATASQENAGYLRELGADEVIDYKTVPFDSVVKNVDMVFDTVGGDTQQRSFAVLKPGGYLIAITQPPSQEDAAKHNVHAVMMSAESSTANLTSLAKLLDARAVKTAVTKTYPLSKAAEAWKDHTTGHIRGKIALIVKP